MSTFRSTDEPPLKSDIVTERYLDERGDLQQLTTFDGVAFRRVFRREEA